jgi:hypothetical protein
LTNAKRYEIFSACEAYTAVFVVFVSSDLGHSTALDLFVWHLTWVRQLIREVYGGYS